MVGSMRQWNGVAVEMWNESRTNERTRNIRPILNPQVMMFQSFKMRMLRSSAVKRKKKIEEAGDGWMDRHYGSHASRWIMMGNLGCLPKKRQERREKSRYEK